MLVENMTTEFKREYVDDIKNTIVAFETVMAAHYISE